METIRLLVEHGAALSAQTRRRLTVHTQSICLIYHQPAHYSAAVGDLQALQFMAQIEGEHLFNWRNNNQETVFHFACSWGHTRLVRWMLSHSNPGPALQLTHPHTCVHHSVQSQEATVVDMLLRHKALRGCASAIATSPDVVGLTSIEFARAGRSQIIPHLFRHYMPSWVSS